MTNERDYVDSVSDGWERIHPDVGLETLSISLRIIRAGRILQAHLDEIASQHGFTMPGDYEVLAALRRSQPEPLQPAQIAERLMVTTSGMTGRLDRLERDELIERRPRADDRRGIDVHITATGIAAADRVFRDRLGSETSMFSGLSERKQTQLVALLRTVLAHMGDQPTELR